MVNNSGKKNTATDGREWGSSEKKYTAFDQKKLVSGNVIFFRKKNIRYLWIDLFLAYILRLNFYMYRKGHVLQ